MRGGLVGVAVAERTRAFAAGGGGAAAHLLVVAVLAGGAGGAAAGRICVSLWLGGFWFWGWIGLDGGDGWRGMGILI